MRLLLTIAVLMLAAPSSGSAQVARMFGRVVEASTGSGLPGASVQVKSFGGTDRAMTTDAEGRFETRLQPGDYVLNVRFVGFKPVTDTLSVSFGQDLEVVVGLQIAEGLLDEILVEDDRYEQPRGAALETIRPAALARVPMPDVTYDLAAYLLTMPGFVSVGDRGGQLFIRGGTPTQNLVTIDGIPVFQPFHIVGFYSAFPADIVAHADVYAGGFGARYGGRISSVVDVQTRNGDKANIRGAASLAPFLSSIRVEIPLSKNRVSLIASWRESVIDRIAPEFLGRRMPFRFGDRFAKIHAFISKTSSLEVLGLQTHDEGDLLDAGSGSEGDGTAEERPASWKNDAVGYRYTYVPEDAAVVAEFSMYYSKMKSRYVPSTFRPQNATVSAFRMNLDIAYLLGDLQVHFGLFGNLNKFLYDLGNRFGSIRSGVTNGGIFIETRMQLGRSLSIEPGFRVETFSRGLKTSVDPRLRATFLALGDRQQWSLAWGRYHQQIIGLNNEQDVSDVFTVWAASPRNLPVPQSEHLIGGVRHRLGPGLDLSVEAYRKSMSNLSFPVFRTELEEPSGYSRIEGTATGIDASLEVLRPSWYASIAYSWARTTYRWTGSGSDNPVIPGLTTASVPVGEEFHPPHDRRHQVNAMTQINRGPWRLSVRWQYGSGLPFTQINGYYDAVPVSLVDPQGYTQVEGSSRVSRSDLFAARLPSYHRLDVSVERDINVEGVKATLQAGVINAYNRANLFEYNFFSGERVDQLPIVPSIGLKVQIP